MVVDLLKKIYTLLFDTLQSILVFGSVMIVIYVFIMRPFEVSGESMFPTFKNGEFILTNLITPRYGELNKGDVVVFDSPVDDKDYIKRIIAKEGDTLELKDGAIYINGTKLDESEYIDSDIKTPQGSSIRESSTITVEANKIIVMGDNRYNSSDSREWGQLNEDAVIGKSFFVYWPPNKMRLVKNPFDN